MKKKIAIAADHAGIQLKKIFLNELTEWDLVDFGTDTNQSVDYPDYAQKACNAVIEGKCEVAILICGSGIGMSIAANKIPGIRAAHVESSFTAQLAKQHNNANVLCIGERITGQAHAIAMVRAWMNTTFEQRHQERINKIHRLEN